MLNLKETVFLKQRQGKKAGETYESGWMLSSSLRSLLDVADKAGLNAVGFGNIRDVKTTKFTGKVIELSPFALSAKK